MQDLQSVWLLLLHCAPARANYQIRAVCLAAVETQGENIWQCLGRILQIDPAQCSNEVRESATLGRLSSNDFGDSSSGGRPIDRPTRGSPSHTHLESCQRLSPPVDPSLSHPLGGRSRMGPDLRRANLISSSSAGAETGGSTKRHRELKHHFGALAQWQPCFASPYLLVWPPT